MEIYFCETNEIFEKAAMFGLQANMTMYLTEQYHLSSALASGVCNDVMSFVPRMAINGGESSAPFLSSLVWFQ
jgi:dipeptide/tripeptide permease